MINSNIIKIIFSTPFSMIFFSFEKRLNVIFEFYKFSIKIYLKILIRILLAQIKIIKTKLKHPIINRISIRKRIT